MSNTITRPVIFLAFANDRDDTVGYLRNLPDEARRLRDVLEPAEQAGLCEVVVRSNSTAGDIFKIFQDPKYRNRVAIFHYGGHANGYQLLLESPEGKAAAADAGGLAAFLAQQQGLQLVFLNGCSTQQQTRELLDANISAVISTSRSIDDQVATDFAWQLYQGLAGGATIRTAYNEAEASVQTAKGGNTRALYFGDAEDSISQLEADRWPWNLYLREGSERADQWNLPEAVNDPLFGLPPLPEQDLPESPYRHLNWFTRKDAEVFFGRGRQIRALYDRLTAPRTAPIMLFYGQSGVGKSSILDAGLIPRLEQNYEVRYLRRTEGGLLDTLRLAFLPEAADAPIETAWRVKEELTGKPLIVFLDQIEELYTRPITELPDELNQFLRVVKATFVESDQRPRGKLVLGFRKEWLAELEAQLVDYELPRSKVFLEPLDRRGIIEVALGPARSARLHERYGLTVEDGLAEIIADDMLGDRDSAIAPTLQILLTKMWSKATGANYEHPQFSQELYQHLKRDGILLRDFLNQQIAAFRERYPEAVDSGLLLDIVALHTTPLGTADQCSVAELQQQYAHLDDTLPDILQQCQDLHLLTVAASTEKEIAKTTRLAHDTLAPLVREQFDVSDKPGQRARRILDNRSVDWVEERGGTPLDETDLTLVEQGASGTRALSSTEQRLLEASRDLRTKLQRTRKFLTIAAAAAAVIIVVVAGIAVWKWREAEDERSRAQKGQIVSLVDAIFLSPPATAGKRMKTLTEVTTSAALREYAVKQLKFRLDKQIVAAASRDERDALTRGKANVAVGLLIFGATDEVWRLLKHRDDPALRSYLIHGFSQTGADAESIAAQLEKEQQPSIRRALILSLGEFNETTLPSKKRKELVPKLAEFYRDDADPGVHAATEWLLRSWEQDLPVKKVIEPRNETDQQLKAATAEDKRSWFVNSQGQTMILITGPVEFGMGSPESESGRVDDEKLHTRKIVHSFAIAAGEVTVRQFLKFRKDHPYEKEYAPELDCPVNMVNWYEAANYCNWLSEQEGIDKDQWCYRPNAEGKFAEDMTIATDYLTLHGYRLPTEAEWEYACRGGSTSSFSMGGTESLLDKYGWSISNSNERSSPVGILKPNDFGFFDMHGNAYEWSQMAFVKEYTTDNNVESLTVTEKDDRVIRGGSFNNGASSMRSAFRNMVEPSYRSYAIGLRVARTYP